MKRPSRTPADLPPHLTGAHADLIDAGLSPTIGHLGGGILSVEVPRAYLPDGLHAYLVESTSGVPGEQVSLVVGWDAPATERDARDLLLAATFGDEIEEAGDDTLAWTGARVRASRYAVRLALHGAALRARK